MAEARAPLSLVIIYSRKDREFLRELLEHLSPLEHQNLIAAWYDQDLKPGDGWRQEIETRLKSAEVVLVLVSASCLASMYCRTEIGIALELHHAHRLRVVPVKLHDVDWEGEPLADLQTLPKHGGALSTSANRHSEMAEVARAIRKLADAGIPLEPRPKTERRSEAPDTSMINDQALAFTEQGDLRSAQALLEPVLESAREAHGPNLAILLSNYAHILRTAGKLEAAREALEEALALPSSPDPALSIRLDRLASVLRELGEPQLAKERAEQALEIALQAYGENHPAVAVRRNTLGLIWTDLGLLGKAIAEFEKAMSILLYCRDERHPAVAAVRGNLALALRDRGDLKMARRHAEQALADDREAYVDSHPAIATDLNTLGLILRDLGEGSLAVSCLRKAKEILFQVFGDLHPSTQAVRENLRITVPRVS
jgi:tetratricopeptide (TPR) repeat protein